MSHLHPRPRLATIGALLAIGIIAAPPAFAADLPLRGSLPSPVPVADVPGWTGFHVGFDAGYARTGNQHLRTVGLTAQEQLLIDVGGIGAVAMPGSSFVLRGGLGYDHQFTRGSGFVVGIEADAGYTNLQRTRMAAFGFGDNAVALVARQTLDFLGTVRGRLGYAFGGVLLYGTGGFAYGGVGIGGQTALTNAAYSGVYDGGVYRGIDTGYAYGGGVEILAPAVFTPAFLGPGSVSFKAEYLRYDLGSRPVTIGGIGPVFGPGGPMAAGATAVSTARTQGHFATAGVHYRFSGWPY